MTRAREMIGFVPETPIQEGVRQTAEYYKSIARSVSGRYNVFKQDDYMK